MGVVSTVWYWTVGVADGPQPIDIPWGAKFLTLGRNGRGEPTAYFLVDPEAPKEPKSFYVFGTGHLFDISNKTYLGTFNQGPFVWHVFLS